MWERVQRCDCVLCVVCVEPSVAQLVERLTVVLYAVHQCARKSIGRWFDSGHSDLCCSPGSRVGKLSCLCSIFFAFHVVLRMLYCVCCTAYVVLRASDRPAIGLRQRSLEH